MLDCRCWAFFYTSSRLWHKTGKKWTTSPWYSVSLGANWYVDTWIYFLGYINNVPMKDIKHLNWVLLQNAWVYHFKICSQICVSYLGQFHLLSAINLLLNIYRSVYFLLAWCWKLSHKSLYHLILQLIKLSTNNKDDLSRKSNSSERDIFQMQYNLY